MKKHLLVYLAIVTVFVVGLLAWWPRESTPAQPSKRDSAQHTGSGATTQPTGSFDRTTYSVTEPSSPWVVVNKQHPLSPLTYAPSDLVAVGNGQYMRAEAATALKAMLAGAASAGYSVTPASGYRSYPTQVSVYNAEVKNYGQATADSESARPGYSEHQSGWAIDLASGSCSITDCFGATPGGEWVSANAYRYGFILRYPGDKVAITGYRAEAWHFRYVGTSLARELHDQHVETLEEFFDVSGGTNYK